MNARLFLAILFLTTSLRAEWPKASVTDAAKLREHAAQIALALQKAGQPLTADAAKSLTGDTAAVEAALDPLCAAAVSVGPDGALTVSAPSQRPRLLEQGWRAFLIKVVNPAARTGTLRLDSPNAGPLPNAPAAAVKSRWLALDAAVASPFGPNLSGQPLEYRVVSLWARDESAGTATLTFNLSADPPADSAGRRWEFDGESGGWQAAHDCRIEVKDGELVVTKTGADPQVTNALKLPHGEVLLRFHAKNSGPPNWQVFWATERRPEFSGRQSEQINVFQDLGQGSDYRVTLRPDSPLTGLRIDPGTGAGTCSLAWIEALPLGTPSPQSTPVEVACEIERSTEVKFSVHDERGAPCTAGFVIRDARGRVYPMMSKRLAPDFFFHEQIYRAHGESVRLPAGEYSVRCQRGPESRTVTKKLTVRNDGAPDIFDYKVERWIDPSLRGWWSGDHHIHAAGCAHYTNPSEGVHAADMQRHIMGEDLKVGCNLTWGPCFDYQKQFFTGRIDPVSQYPYLLRYDIEVSGFGSHQSGHLCLLRLKEQIIPGGESKNHWPTLGLNTLKWAKRQGAVCGPAHSGSGLGGNTGRVEGPDGPNGLPNFNIPKYDGIGANEYIVDITHEVPGPDGKPVPPIDFISTMDTDRRQEFNMWYHSLNCGFRVRASGETDFPCITGERVGDGRVYVKVDGKLEFDAWCEGIRNGRSYVSDGSAHLMEFSAGGARAGENGSELKLAGPQSISLSVRCATLGRGGPRKAEAIVNGWPVAEKEVAADGTETEVTFDVKIERSSWVAVRMFPHAHTNPVFVIVQDKPIRASRRSAEWARRGVDQCWKSKEPTYAAAEKAESAAAYDHARKVYDRIIAECTTD